MVINRPTLFFSLALLSLLGCAYLEYDNDHANRQLTLLEKNLHSLSEEVNSEANVILTDPGSVTWHLLRNSFFLIDSTRVLAWSNNQFFPDLGTVNSESDFQLSQSTSGDFLIKSWQINTTKRLIAVIPLVRKFPISNRYLSSAWNETIFGKARGAILDAAGPAGSIVSLNGREAFKIQLESVSTTSRYSLFVLACAALICFIIGIYFLARPLHQSKKHEWVFLVCTGAFVLMRIVMVYFNYPARWLASSVFDPQYFASASYNSSIGDLFINSIGVMVICCYVFLTYHRWSVTKHLLSLQGWARYVSAVFLITLAFFSFLYPFLFVETIFHNSAIALDITQSIQFDWLRSLSWLSVLAGCVSAFFFIHVLINMAKALYPTFLIFFTVLILAASLFTIYFLVASRDYFITLPIAFVFFLILHATRLSSSLRKLGFVTFIYLFAVVTALGVQHGLSIKHFEEEKQAHSQFKFAANYLIGRDVLGEYLLNESAKRIEQDAFIQSRLNNPFLIKSPIRQKIKQVYLNSYFDRYDSRIYLYNSAGEPLDNVSPETLAMFSDRFQNTSNKTEYEGIYFIQPSELDPNKKYLSLIPIYRMDAIIGFVLIDLSLKRIIPQNVYPELLVDRRFAEYFENRDRSFSFIKNGKILSSFGNYNYERDFDFTNLTDFDFFNTGIRSNGFFHTGVEDVTGSVVVTTSTSYPVFYVLTNFSFLFVSGIILLVIAMLIYWAASVVNGLSMNYAARIQLYIYLAFSLPLFVATITTLNRVSKSAEDELNSNFEARARQLGESILPIVSEFFNGTLGRDDFENILIDRAKVSNFDITFYDRAGKHVASSQPLIVESQITSAWMNRVAWEKITLEGAKTLIADEKIGSLYFNNCYVTLKSPESGELLGILSVPFFDSFNSLEETQVNVLSNFLTVFTLIFILFSVLSFYVVNSLTFPLRFITRILARTTLSGVNKPLEWKSNDEIGMMVSEYNRMVHNLEQSKLDLARSQKESAWREIAKQVAHEIKNPLTPMKLTLQQMEHQLMANKLDDEKARTSITTLLTQVDILNDIASSFSAFARMPAPILERVDLVPLISKSVNLYSDYQGGEVKFTAALRNAFVMSDGQLLSRIFSNIILNGLQSGGNKVRVEVSLDQIEKNFLISIHDNGKGIEPEMIDKVFVPYFSTKHSGSGLGLAISKQGIEQSAGEIWFETTVESGTTFFIKLPRVEATEKIEKS